MGNASEPSVRFSQCRKEVQYCIPIAPPLFTHLTPDSFFVYYTQLTLYRSHFVVVLQESCTLWSLLIHNFGTIVATVVAALVFCGLFLVIYILHKTLSPHRNSNKSSYDNNNQKQQQKRKKRNKASMQHGGQKTNNRLQPRIHTTSHNDDDDDGGSKEFDEQQQQQQQAPSVSMADATTAIETETAPLKSGIPSSQEAIHSTATKEQVVPSSNDFDPISMSAAVSDSSHSSTFTHCQEGMAGGDDDTAVTSNLTTLPPPPGLSAVSKANGRKSNRRTRKTAIKEDDGSSNSQHVKAPHFPSGGSKRWNILSSAANETLQTGTTIPAAPCFSSSAPGTAALEYNLFNHSAQQLIPPTGGSSFYSAQTPPGFSQYTAGQTVSDPMDLPGISLQYARPPYHSSLDPIQSPTKTSSDLQSIFPIACPSSNNIFQTPGRNHFHDNVSATTSVSSPFGTPISSESISLFSESLGDATAAATTCSTTASPWGNGGTLITPTTTPRRNIPPPPGMAMQQQLRPDNHLLLPSFGPSQSKPRWDEYGYYCGGERVSGSGTATTTTTTTTSTASNLAVGTSFSPSPQRRQHQQQLPASPMVRDNPFQNDEEDQIVAELQELGGQMVGSVLDF